MWQERKREREFKLKNAQTLFPICDYTNHFSFVTQCVRFASVCVSVSATTTTP